MTNEERLAALFQGLDRAHGVSRPSGKTSGRGKAEARYQTKREPITPEAWGRHLAGEEGLVVIPIRDDGTVMFGAVDIDTYPLDLTVVARRIDELGLPLTVCRTKSGGAHLYFFAAEPIPAGVIQKRLSEWAIAIGHPRTEIFPKQTSLSSTDDTGNGINAPYFGKDTVRYAVGPDGKALTLLGFVERAERLRTREQDLPSVDAGIEDDMVEAPPCLQHWARIGVSEGQRNDVMFDFAIYAKKRWADGWQQRFEDMNRRYCSPPLPASEVLTIIKSVGKQKGYVYRAKCEGPHCNPALCKKQEHGKGGGYDDPGVVIDSLVVVLTDPKTFIVSVNGKRIEMNSAVFDDQRRFRLAVLENLMLSMKPLKAKLWNKLKERLLSEKEIIEAPEDAGPRGQILQNLDEFFDQQATLEREKLRLEHCWHDVERGRMYFRGRDFMTYLKRHRVYGVNERDIFNVVRQAGGNGELLKIGKTPLRVWWVPREDEQQHDPIPEPVDPGRVDGVPF